MFANYTFLYILLMFGFLNNINRYLHLLSNLNPTNYQMFLYFIDYKHYRLITGLFFGSLYISINTRVTGLYLVGLGNALGELALE